MFRTALTVLALAVVATSAQAEPKRELRIVRVAYGDIDLATATGARVMLHRLTSAARSLCVELHTPVLPGESGRADRCRKETIAAAVERLHRPQLTVALAELPPEP